MSILRPLCCSLRSKHMIIKGPESFHCLKSRRTRYCMVSTPPFPRCILSSLFTFGSRLFSTVQALALAVARNCLGSFSLLIRSLSLAQWESSYFLPLPRAFQTIFFSLCRFFFWRQRVRLFPAPEHLNTNLWLVIKLPHRTESSRILSGESRVPSPAPELFFWQ